MNNKDISLNDCIKELEKNADLLKSGDLSLEDSIQLFAQSKELFDLADSMLKDIKQKIQIYDPDRDLIEDFNVKL